MQVKIKRDQAIWERETFYVDVPDGLTGDALRDAVEAAADDYDGERRAETLCEVRGISTETVAVLPDGAEIEL